MKNKLVQHIQKAEVKTSVFFVNQLRKTYEFVEVEKVFLVIEKISPTPNTQKEMMKMDQANRLHHHL